MNPRTTSLPILGEPSRTQRSMTRRNLLRAGSIGTVAALFIVAMGSAVNAKEPDNMPKPSGDRVGTRPAGPAKP
jgi:hypothetical protein